jgi:hypothetical protein
MNYSDYSPKESKVSEKVMIEYLLSRLTRKLQDTAELIRKTGDSQWNSEMIVLVDSLLQLENIRTCKRILVETNISNEYIKQS